MTLPKMSKTHQEYFNKELPLVKEAFKESESFDESDIELICYLVITGYLDQMIECMEEQDVNGDEVPFKVAAINFIKEVMNEKEMAYTFYTDNKENV